MSARNERGALRTQIDLIVAHIEYDRDRVTDEDARSHEFVAAVKALADAARRVSSVREGGSR